MKNDLPFFSHDNNAGQHPKMRALIAEYGYAGYGMFWALNEKIARSDGACIDISRKVYKLDLANELRLNNDDLDKFIAFLSDPEIDLININNGIITTDRINELYSKVIESRVKERNKKTSKKGKVENPQGKEDFPEGKAENPQGKDNRIEEKRIDKNKREENKQDFDGSGEPPVDLSLSQKQAIELSELLLKLHRDEFPDYLSGKKDAETISRWAVDIEKLIRIDKKPPENIWQIIRWVKTPENFWFSNIESGKKLRQQYEKLWSQMQTRGFSPEEKKARERERILQEGIDKAEKVSAEWEKRAREASYDGMSLVDGIKEAVKNGEIK